MGLFRYEAVDRSGKVVRGVMDAASEQQVAQKLGAMGYSARSVYNGAAPQSNAGQAPAQPQQSARLTAKGGIESVTLPNGVPVSIKSSVPPSAMAVFFRQMATLIRSGQPIYQASTVMRISNGKLRNVLEVIGERVKNGQKLSGAMAEFPGVFPVHAIASVWCGELAGKLDVVLDEVASDFEREASDYIYGRVGWVITKISIILMIFIMPLADLNHTLTAVAGQGLGAVSQLFADTFRQTLPLMIAAMLSWSIWGVLKRVHLIKYALDNIMLKVPVWGKLHRFRSIARFTHMMDLLTTAGIYPATAWDAAALTPRNSAIAARLKLAKPAASTDGIVTLLERSRVFDHDDVGLAASGEQAGCLPEAVGNISKNYTMRADAAKSFGKTWSLSMLFLAQIVMGGVIMIMVAKGYANFLAPLLDGAGL